jgi:hypothetical protein
MMGGRRTDTVPGAIWSLKPPRRRSGQVAQKRWRSDPFDGSRRFENLDFLADHLALPV